MTVRDIDDLTLDETMARLRKKARTPRPLPKPDPGFSKMERDLQRMQERCEALNLKAGHNNKLAKVAITGCCDLCSARYPEHDAQFNDLGFNPLIRSQEDVFAWHKAHNATQHPEEDVRALELVVSLRRRGEPPQSESELKVVRPRG